MKRYLIWPGLILGLLAGAADAGAKTRAPAAAPGEVVAGRASIIDGDTIDIHGTRIRLSGIDTPERGQSCERAGAAYRCGTEASRVLDGLVADQPVSCAVVAVDRYGRLVATCHKGALDLNGEMVRLGWALAYRTYSTAYVGAEDEARVAHRGLWAGTFEAPWDWRRARRHQG
jgi:endonuclease YncB( thermonuclease family)